MRRFERLGNLPRDQKCVVNRDRSLRNSVGERVAFDQFQNQRPETISLLESVDGGDVRMIDRGEQPRLPLEPREPFRI